jgi:hypothetical protein
MSPLICFYFIICIGWVQGEMKYQSYTDTWYQTWINNSVVSPFLTAYTTLNNKIIKKLMLSIPNSDEKTIKSLVNLLKCRFETVHTQLRRANDANVHIRNSLQHQENILLRRINSQEKLVRSKEKDVNETKISLENVENQIKVAELAKNDYQRSLNTAEHNVQTAQNAVDRSNKCRRRRRKKRFLSLCGLLNWSGSKNAHERLSLTMHNKHSAQHRLTVQQQSLTSQRFRHKVAESQLKTATSQLHIFQSKLNQTRILFKLISSLTHRFKIVETYVTEILGSSTVFKDQLMNLIDFENVIDPLNNIYEEMIDNKLIIFNNNIDISTETIYPINKNLEKVKETIKTWDLIEIDENDISVPCLLTEND